jgi:hypothetical protein
VLHCPVVVKRLVASCRINLDPTVPTLRNGERRDIRKIAYFAQRLYDRI